MAYTTVPTVTDGDDLIDDWGNDVATAVAELQAAVPDAIVTSFTPVLGATSNPNLGSTGQALGRYVRSGRLITVEFFFEFGGTGISQGSGTYFVAPPITIASPLGANATLKGKVAVTDNGVGIREFTPIRAGAAAIAWRPINPTSYGDATSITSSTIGLTFAAGDRVAGVVDYFI